MAYCHRFDVQVQSSRVYFVACTVGKRRPGEGGAATLFAVAGVVYLFLFPSLFCLLLVSFVTKVVDAEVTFVWSPDCFLKRPGRTGRAQLLGGAGAHRCPAGSRLVHALPGRCPGAGQSAQAGQPQHRGGAQAGGLLARFPVITAHPVPPGPRGCGALHLSLPLGLWPQDRPAETQLQKSPVGQCQVLL